MAKRMGYSVVGLPHYTIWHLYEPSEDDIRHMQEMDKERVEKEAKEKEEREKMEKVREQFDNPSEQWDKDKADIRDMAKKASLEREKAKEAAGAAEAAKDAPPVAL